MRKYSVIGLFVLFCLNFSFTQVEVNSRLDDNKMLIGDQRIYRIELISPQPLKDIIADIEKIDTTGKVEILNQGSWSDSMSHTYFKEWTITCFDSGYYQLLPIPIRFESMGQKQRVYSKPLAFIVDNPTIDSSGMADIKTIIEEPKTIEDYLSLIYGLLILALVSLVVWYFLLKKKKEKKEEQTIIVPKPAHEIAIGKLHHLKEQKLWQQEKIKDYYSELTFITREYLENRYKIRALEYTTQEILEELKKYGFSSELQLSLKNILLSADIVKFAKGKPAAELHEKFWKEAESFILQTKE